MPRSGLSFQFLGCDLARDRRPVTRPATPPSLFGYGSVLRGKLMALNAVRGVGKFVPPWKRYPGHNVSQRHSGLRAFRNGFALDAGFLCYLNKPMTDAFNLHKDSAALIALLLFLRRPSAVFGAVTEIVVNAIKGIQRAWLGPHVCGKLSKRIPLGANADTAPAIRIPLPEIGVVAPVPHRRPSGVKRVGYFEWQGLVSYMTRRQCSMALCHEQGGYENS